MDYHDFLRIAPRYLDGEVSDTERAAIESFILRNAQAQAEIDALTREAAFIRDGFHRPGEDLSQVALRARRRNPHRKATLSPTLAITVQAIALIGLFGLLLYTANELAPPDAGIITTDKQLAVEFMQTGLNAFDPLPFGEGLSTAPGAEAEISIGLADRIRVNHATAFRLRAPRPEARHVIELGLGEMWGTFRDNQHDFRIEFAADSLRGAAVRGRGAEIDIAAGRSIVGPLLPRGYPIGRRGLPSAIVRVIDGAALLERPEGKPIVLKEGEACVLITAESEPVILRDPDAAYYPALRRLPGGRFKHEWNWLHPSKLPLSVSIATYDVWKASAETAEEVNTAREEALKELSASKIEAFREDTQRELNTLLAAAGAGDERGGTTELELEVGASELTRKWMVEAVYTGKNTDELAKVLAYARAPVEDLLDAWSQPDPGSYSALYATSRVEDAAKLLSSYVAERERRLARSHGAMDGVSLAESQNKAAESALVVAQKAIEPITTHERFDRSGEQRAELVEKIDKLETERRRLDSVLDLVEQKEFELEPLETEVRRAAAQVATLQFELQGLEDEATGIRNDLTELDFNNNRVSELEDEVERLRLEIKRYQQRASDGRVKLVDLDSKTRELEMSLATAKDELVAARTLRAAKKSDLKNSEEALPTLRRRADRAWETRRVAYQALQRVPPEKREVSEEALAYERATQAHLEAEGALRATKNTIKALIEEVAETERKNSALTEKIESESDLHEKTTAQLESTKKTVTQAEKDEQEASANLSAAQKNLAEAKVTKASHDALNDNLSDLQNKIGTKKDEIQTAEDRQKNAQSAFDPVYKEYQKLRGEYDKRGAVVRELEAHKRKVSQIDARMRQYAAALRNLVDTWRDVAESRVTIVRRVYQAASALRIRAENPALRLADTLGKVDREYAEAYGTLEAPIEDIVEREALVDRLRKGYEDVATEATELLKDERAALIFLIDSVQRNRLGLTWMSLRAQSFAEKVSRDNTALRKDFSVHRAELSGFPASDMTGVEMREPADKSTLRAKLEAILVRQDIASTRQLPTTWSEKIWQERAQLLARQWQQYGPQLGSGVQNENSTRNDPRKSKSSTSYYNALTRRLDVSVIQDVNVNWTASLQAWLLENAEEKKAAEQLLSTLAKRASSFD